MRTVLLYWEMTKTAQNQNGPRECQNGPCGKSKTAPIGPFWMTKTAHAEVQNGPDANRNDQNGPEVKWPKLSYMFKIL